MKKRILSLILAVILCASVLIIPASAKTIPDGQTVGTVLFYVKNANNEKILVSQIDVSQIDADLKSGKIDNTVYNYSVLDHYITTLHQECQGFTVPEFITYAQEYSTVDALKSLNLTFAGNDAMRFWEIDDSAGDEDVRDIYTWNDLYAVQRYNFPLLYEYWNYRTQDYYDPAGKMSRDEVIDYIFDHGEKTQFMLSANAFSQRYMITDEKYEAHDFNMENYWFESGKLDSQRTIRMFVGMTEDDLRNKGLTASNTRYWVWNLLLDMEKDPAVTSLGTVAAPTASMTEDADNYYIDFACTTPGATIYYNHNYRNVSYTPTQEYTDTVTIPKQYFKNGTVTITAHAVKDGCTDAGVVSLELQASGPYTGYVNPYSDVEEGAWYYDNVKYVTEKGYFDAVSPGKFGPAEPMTRAMLATALYRMAGEPKADGITSTPFTDVSPSADYADAVAWCYFAGVVNGTSETTFTPEASITREQIVTMFHRYAEKVAKADMSVTNDLDKFTDADKLSAWASDGMKWAVAAGLINGMTDTTIVPQGTAIRAQVAAMVQRLDSFVA